MGKPSQSYFWLPVSEHIGHEEGTRGNDTSEYPEEKKESLDSLSSGERKGRSLNSLRESPQALRSGGCRSIMVVLWSDRGVTKRAGSRTGMDTPGHRG
jgi:hypothetical protein